MRHLFGRDVGKAGVADVEEINDVAGMVEVIGEGEG